MLSLAGVTLAPGVDCFDNAATLTGVLTATGLSVVMDGGASEYNSPGGWKTP